MRTRGRLEHSLCPFFNSHFIFSTVWHLSSQISKTKWTVTIVFTNYSNRLTLMVGGSIYDTVASRVDIASFIGPHLHFMSTRSIFLDCKSKQSNFCLSSADTILEKHKKPGMSFEFSFPTG